MYPSKPFASSKCVSGLWGIHRNQEGKLHETSLCRRQLSQAESGTDRKLQIRCFDFSVIQRSPERKIWKAIHLRHTAVLSIRKSSKAIVSGFFITECLLAFEFTNWCHVIFQSFSEAFLVLHYILSGEQDTLCQSHVHVCTFLSSSKERDTYQFGYQG